VRRRDDFSLEVRHREEFSLEVHTMEVRSLEVRCDFSHLHSLHLCGDIWELMTHDHDDESDSVMLMSHQEVWKTNDSSDSSILPTTNNNQPHLQVTPPMLIIFIESW
jgi:hypothetical protein